MPRWCIDIIFHITGTEHCGYCSDPVDITSVDYIKTIRKFNPKKEFVDKYCEEDGSINEYGIGKFNHTRNSDSCGSGHCGTSEEWEALSAQLKIVENVKEKFLKEKV